MASYPALSERLVSAEAKIKRAFQRVDELQILINDASTVSLEDVQDDPTDGSILLGYKVRTDEISASIGEIAFNLRSSLDQMWRGLLMAAGDLKPRGKYFPIRESRQSLITALDDRFIKEAFPQAVDLILNDIKPHSEDGSNGYIFVINELCNTDKHDISIIPSHVVSNAVTTINVGGMTITLADNDFSGPHPIIQSYLPVQYEEVRQGQVSFTFSADTPVVGGKPILETAVNLAQATREVLELFKRNFT